MIFTEEEVKKSTLEYFKGDELATNVWMTKYALKNKNNEFLEKTPDDMHRRLAKEFARIEKKFNKNSPLDEEKIYSYFKDFKYIVPQGSPMYGIGNDYSNSSLSNCMVVDSPEDSISSIFDKGKELANLYKQRAGVGIDISTLRPEGAFVNNSAKKTSGAWSFADFYSYITRMIGQGGRRGACIVTMHVNHPDIFKFVTMKKDLKKVTGANVSVKITDEFMNAVEEDEEFTLKFPVDSDKPLYTNTIKAKELWDLIVKTATETAEPGILMWDSICNNLPSHEYKMTQCVNPCSEISMSAYSACRLISINLKNFVSNAFLEDCKFDFKKFEEVCKTTMRLADNLIELEKEKLANLIEISNDSSEKEVWRKLYEDCDYRRTGIGTHGLADVFLQMCAKYDSEKALKISDQIYSTLRNATYGESIKLAQERGTFKDFFWEREKENLFIKRLPKHIKELLKRYGRRNVSILTNAPTGSVSIISQTSSGIEPIFRMIMTRRRKLTENEDIKPDFIDELGDKWQEYNVYHHAAKEWKKIFNKEEFDSYFITSDQISWKKRVDLQSIIQHHIDHSISSTINLPKGTESKIVDSIYKRAWKKGLKGITVYVDGSRDNVLLEKKERKENFFLTTAPKRPETLECDIHHVTVKGEKWTILVGLMEGKPYECLGGLATYVDIPKKYSKGFLKKNKFKTKNNTYDLKIGENGNEFIIRDIVKIFDDADYAAFTRMISLSLRHGAAINYIVEQLQKDKDADMFSFAKCIARVLKTYIVDGTKVSSGLDKICCQCKAPDSLVYKEGCVMCQNCGFSKCG